MPILTVRMAIPLSVSELEFFTKINTEKTAVVKFGPVNRSKRGVKQMSSFPRKIGNSTCSRSKVDKESRTIPVYVRFSPSEYEKLSLLSVQLRCSDAETIRRIVKVFS